MKESLTGTRLLASLFGCLKPHLLQQVRLFSSGSQDNQEHR